MVGAVRLRRSARRRRAPTTKLSVRASHCSEHRQMREREAKAQTANQTEALIPATHATANKRRVRFPKIGIRQARIPAHTHNSDPPRVQIEASWSHSVGTKMWISNRSSVRDAPPTAVMRQREDVVSEALRSSGIRGLFIDVMLRSGGYSRRRCRGRLNVSDRGDDREKAEPEWSAVDRCDRMGTRWRSGR